VGGRTAGSNLLSLALFAGGCPAFGRDRSAGGGGVERFAGAVAVSEVMFKLSANNAWFGRR
jgi:hypothetical protein